MEISSGSGSEVRYLVDLAYRLGFMAGRDSKSLVEQYTEVVGGLQCLIESLSREP